MTREAGAGRKILIGALLVVVVGALIAANLLIQGDSPGGVSFSFGGKGKEVDFTRVRRGELSAVVEASGVLEAATEVMISSELVGRIERLYFGEGDRVQRGEILLELERTEIQARLDRQRANLEIARANRLRARARVEEAQRLLERQEGLFAEGILSEQEIDAGRTEVRVLEAQLLSARQSVAQARADLDSALKDLDKTTIRAPMSGTLTRLHAEEGEVVVTGTMNNPGSVILELADLSGVLVAASVDQSDVPRVRLGQQAEVEVDALLDRVLEGTVEEIASSGNRQGEVTTFPVKVRILSPEPELRPGMTAHVTIATDHREDCLLLPVGAVMEKLRRDVVSPEERADLTDREAEEILQVVYVMRDGRAQAMEVDTGISDDYEIEILEGLQEGQPVVSGPFRVLRFIEPEDRIQPSEDGREVLEEVTEESESDVEGGSRQPEQVDPDLESREEAAPVAEVR